MLKKELLPLLLLFLPLSILQVEAAPPTQTKLLFLQYNITIELDEIAHETLKLKLKNLGNSPVKVFNFTVLVETSNFKVKDDFGNVEFGEKKGKTIECYLNKPILPNSEANLTISFNSPDFIGKIKDKYIFGLGYLVEAETKVFCLRVSLPEGMGIVSPKLKGISYPSIHPHPQRLYTDGRRIIVEWEYLNLSRKESLDFSVKYEPMYRGKNVQSAFLNMSFLILSFIFGLSLGLAPFFLVLRKRKTNYQPRIFTINKAHKEILDAIKERNGEITQEELSKILNMSKSKISTALTELERAGVIKREQFGKTKMIHLVIR